MRIGVISDTHGNVSAVRMALEALGDVDLIVHAGDVLYHPPRLGYTEGYDIPATVELFNSLKIPLVIAQGNCDAQVYEELLKSPVQSPYAFTRFESTGLLASHGHLMSKSRHIELAVQFGAAYAITGHTHIPVLKSIDGVIYMNPGSPSLPKYEVAGKPIPSAGLITEKEAVIVNIANGDTLMQI